MNPIQVAKIPWWIGAIALLMTLTFLTTVGALVYMGLQHGESTSAFWYLLGVLSAAEMTILSFCFGSSIGSWAKNSLLTQTAAPLPPPSPPLPPTPVPPVEPTEPLSTQEPVLSSPFDLAPDWFKWALHEIGTKEDPGNHGAALARYRELAHAGSDGEPWCAIFANAALESVGLRGTRSASSQSFRSSSDFVPLAGPALGALAVFWRGSRTSGLGHVGFYRGEDTSRVWVLGGNESDMVQIEALAKDSPSFGLIGYWWPATRAKPPVSPIIMPAGSPISVRVDPTRQSVPSGRQRRITATIFATANDLQSSAYSDRLVRNDVPAVALPFHFPPPQRSVRLWNTNDQSKTVTAIVDDVGPHNTHDPYWDEGRRPLVEGQYANQTPDQTGHIPTNMAAIDLNLLAAQALGIDGKGLVDWEFV